MSDGLKPALEQQAVLGEGLQWHAPDAAWWWTDIQSSALHAWSPGSGATLRCAAPDRVGSFAHCRSGRLLLGLAKQLAFADRPALAASPGAVQLHTRQAAEVEAAEARTRINDGRTDRRGYFVFGTMNEGEDGQPVREPIGHFYQYSLQHGLRRLALPAVAIANSICFSLDGRTMYFADTLQRCIMQCDYDAEGAQVANVRPFAAVDDTPDAYPDGSVVDREGHLWNAQWGGARVVRYGPDGQVRRILEVPTKNPTCPAFGDAGLGTLAVTTSRLEMTADELARMPLAGSLFSRALPAGLGVPDALFDDQIK
jgi:L-arabinonolactonase